MNPLSDRELYIAIGQSLVVDSLAASFLDDKELESIGRRWYTRYLHELRTAVCADARVQGYLKGNRSHKTGELIAAVADLILGITGVVPPATVAMLIINRGLEALCSGSKD